MGRININIKDDIDEEQSLWCCLRCFQKCKSTGHVIVTFHSGIVVSLDKTKAGNLTFTVYRKS